jgi:hypothetical protein
LTSVGAVSLGAAIYYAVDSNTKEKKYLDETDPALIPSLYSKYNTSYKLRNFSLLSFAAVWLYSQIDLLFFSEDTLPVNAPSQQTGLNVGPGGGMRFSISINF